MRRLRWLLGAWFPLVACGGGPDGGSGGSGGGGSMREESAEPRCLEALEAGTCNVGATHYAFDASTKQCKRVAQCNGSLNQFATEAACATACEGKRLECTSPAGEPCAQIGASCVQYTIYTGYWGGCDCQPNGTWSCML